MATEPVRYTKLPGRGLRRGDYAGAAFFAFSATRSRLWLGPDHLLGVDHTLASEQYRRFYFRDIEAFVIRRTAARQIWNWVLVVLMAISAGPFAMVWYTDGDGGLLVVALVIAAFWTICLLVNTFRGPTCKTHIRTAVQTEMLPSLGRVKLARKILARLQPLIVAAQGEATPDELAAAPWMAAGSVPKHQQWNMPGAEKPLRPERGWLHLWLFGALILEAILVAVSLGTFHQAMAVLSLLAMLAGCILSLVAVIRQRGTTIPQPVRILAGLTLGSFVLKCAAWFVLMIIFAINHPGATVVTGLEIVDEPGFGWVSGISAGLSAVLGVTGLALLLGHFRRPPNQTAA